MGAYGMAPKQAYNEFIEVQRAKKARVIPKEFASMQQAEGVVNQD